MNTNKYLYDLLKEAGVLDPALSEREVRFLLLKKNIGSKYIKFHNYEREKFKKQVANGDK